MKNKENVLYALFLLSFLLLIIQSLDGTFSQEKFNDKIYPILTCLGSMLMLSIPIHLRLTRKVILPLWFFSLIYLALFLHCLGLVNGYYDDLFWWDGITHFLSSMMVTAIGFIVVFLIDWYVEEIRIPPRVMPFIIIAIGCSFGVLWELLEWSFDLIFGTSTQYSLDDTMQDLLTDLLGAVTMGVLGWFFLQRNSPGELAQELGVEELFLRIGRWWGALNKSD